VSREPASAGSRRFDGRERLVILGCLLMAVAVLGAILTRSILASQPLGADFMPMWAAARIGIRNPGSLYDFEAITQAQHAILPTLGKIRPWAYPPSALLLLTAFGLLPFALANVVWTLTGAGLNAWAGLRFLTSQRVVGLLLVFALPPSVLVLLTGQSTFLIAGLAGLAVTVLPTRPILAGVLLGLGAAIKPSALVLIPVALVACGAYRSLAGAIVAGLLTALASSALFGWARWIEWLEALPRFQRLVQDDPSLLRGAITPTALAVNAGVSGPLLLLCSGLFALGGAVIAWRGFSRRADADPARRLSALLGGGMLATPYAMHYDAALLALPAAMLVLRPHPRLTWLVAVLAYMLLAWAVVPYLGAAAMTLAVLILSSSIGRPVPTEGGEVR
jgi:hypothetical protein